MQIYEYSLQSKPVMRGALHIIDDVLTNPQKVRDGVLRGGFETIEFQGSPYYTVNVRYSCDELQDAIEIVLGSKVKINISAFRLGAEKSHLHNYVHADNSCSAIAAVAYFNLPEQCNGGTAFWKNKKYGWDRQPTEKQLEEAGITLSEWGHEWDDPLAWDMVTLAGMKWNRMIIYPTEMLHSRWPWNGFGDTPENSRLIFTAMFDLKE